MNVCSASLTLNHLSYVICTLAHLSEFNMNIILHIDSIKNLSNQKSHAPGGISFWRGTMAHQMSGEHSDNVT